MFHLFCVYSSNKFIAADDEGNKVNAWRRQWQPTPVLLPGKSPWTEEPGGLQSMGSLRVGHD